MSATTARPPPLGILISVPESPERFIRCLKSVESYLKYQEWGLRFGEADTEGLEASEARQEKQEALDEVRVELAEERHEHMGAPGIWYSEENRVPFVRVNCAKVRAIVAYGGDKAATDFAAQVLLGEQAPWNGSVPVCSEVLGLAPDWVGKSYDDGEGCLRVGSWEEFKARLGWPQFEEPWHEFWLAATRAI